MKHLVKSLYVRFLIDNYRFEIRDGDKIVIWGKENCFYDLYRTGPLKFLLKFFDEYGIFLNE